MADIEYEVWYDAHDGTRRLLRGNTKEDVKQHISWLQDQDDKIQQVAASIGLKTTEHDYNVEVFKVTTKREAVSP